MLEEAGIPTLSDLEAKVPGRERLKKGPVAIIECFRSIPCDPCYHSCPVNAIKEFSDINDVPQLDFDRCTGCGMCVGQCPGLAIFVVDYTEGIVKLPYEFLPLPEKGQKVIALNRQGKEICEAEVIRVQQLSIFDKTAVVWLFVPEELLMEVRNFKIGDE